MSNVSMVDASPDDKETLLGREFRNIDVLELNSADGAFLVKIIIDSKPVLLVGDPRKALETLLRGTTPADNVGGHSQLGQLARH